MQRSREQDEFDRIKQHEREEKARRFIEQYEESQAYYRGWIEATRYRIGRLDERLGDVPWPTT
jgi:hypothetical protein